MAPIIPGMAAAGCRRNPVLCVGTAIRAPCGEGRSCDRTARSTVWRELARPAYRGPYGCSCEPAVRPKVGAGGLEPRSGRRPAGAARRGERPST